MPDPPAKGAQLLSGSIFSNWAKKLSSLFSTAINRHYKGKVTGKQITRLSQGLDNLLEERKHSAFPSCYSDF